MDFSKILKEKYEKCDEDTKLLFDILIEKSTKYCISSCSVNMKEFHFRLQKLYSGKRKQCQNFCLFTLTPSKKGVTVHLRTDGVAVDSDVFQIDILRNCSYLRGQEWVKFSIADLMQIDEAIRLIWYIYEYNY